MAQGYSKDQPQGFTNYIEKVAIIGSGGQIGKHITEQLLKNGKHVVTAITRPDSTNKLPEGVQIARVDYIGDETTLVDVLRGQQALIICMAVTAPRDSMSKLLHAADKAGVAYVFPNWWGHDAANDSLCNDSFLTPNRDKIIADTKSLDVTSYIFLVCNFWYEFSLGGGPNRFGFDFQKRSFVIFDDGKVLLNTTTWPQCGRAVAKLLSLKELLDDETDQSPTLSKFRNNSVYISSFRVSQLDIFESVKRVTKTTDTDWTITHESAEQRWKDTHPLVQQGNFSVFTKMLYSRMFFPTADGDYESRRGLDNNLLGLPVEDWDEWTDVAIRMGENGEVPYSH